MEDLIKLLFDRITELDKEVLERQNRISEIERIQKIIRSIKENPYLLFEDEGKKYVDFLGLDSKRIDVCKKIYEGYLTLGREAIPQISMVEEESKKISDELTAKVCFLSDLIAVNQKLIIANGCNKKLLEELKDSEKYITQQDALLLFLKTCPSLSTETKNQIKLEIIDRNNKIHRKLKESLNVSVDEEVVEEKSEFQKAREALISDLEENFEEEALKNLRTFSELITSDANSEKLEEMIGEWKYSIGDDYTKIVDALISIKTIELLDYRDVFGDENQSVMTDIDELRKQIDVLNRYKQVLTMEKEPIVVDTASGNIYQQAVANYRQDLFTYPNRVLLLNKSVGRDIGSIDDKETLKDIFVLIEMLKNNEHERNSKNYTGHDVQQLSPNKEGHQARVRYVGLGNNTYLIVHVDGKKADKTKRETQTISTRLKEVPKLKLNNTHVFNELVEITQEATEKLFGRVSEAVKSKGGE